MAKSTAYVVVHPVRHAGLYYTRGAQIEIGEKEALRLLDKGVIKTADVVIIRGGAILAPATLEKLTLPELCGYASSAHALELKAGLSKAEILAEIAQAAIAVEQGAEAEAIAAEGR